jgi:hypothetical protein
MQSQMDKKTLFDIIDLEDGDSSVLLAQVKMKKDSSSAKYGRLYFCRRKLSEYNAKYNSICPWCKEKKDFLRLSLDHDKLMCYNCFYEGMQADAELSSYHGISVEDVEGFMYDDEWEELWEKENPHMILNEEDDKYYDIRKKVATKNES